MNSTLHVVMIAAEVAPLAKVGGLADVLGALPRELERLGITVSIIIPRYRVIDLARAGFEPCSLSQGIQVPLGHELLDADVHSGRLPDSNVRVFLIGSPRFFDRAGIYVDAETGLDYSDQADRWIVFQRASLEFVRIALPETDVIHSHDFQTALIPAYVDRLYRPHGVFSRVATVFSIHNMGFQGLFPPEVMSRAGFDQSEFQPAGPFEFHNQLNFMKVGISFANLVTTVSETYAREICSPEFGFGLDGVLRDRGRDLVGILNGIDTDVWNPETDPLIPAHYTADSPGGKAENKQALLRAFGLERADHDRPVLAVISRIDVQKGFDLLVSVLEDLLVEDLNFVLLGTGNRETEGYLRTIVLRHSSRAALRLVFNDGLAHLTEAGADIFLMPSKYEPCGLNQMYSMRYGAVPVVRATGGLADTVREFDPATGQGAGFCFTEYSPEHFKNAIHRALSRWRNPGEWRQIMFNGMTSDFSWSRSARKYKEAYERVLAR